MSDAARNIDLADIAERLADIDIAMFSTLTEGGAIATRPMSNNRDVEFDGDSYYFTQDDSRTVAEIEANPQVSLGFSSDDFWAAVTGKAELIRDKSAFEAHWNPDLDEWFDDGVDTEGLLLIKVHASRIRYWDGDDEGEIQL
jgi:general stress protein 26